MEEKQASPGPPSQKTRTETAAEPDTSEPKLQQPRRRIIALDGLRGLAVLLVVVYHYSDQFAEFTQTDLDLTLINWGRSLWMGVDVFFVLSGFLITGILCDTRKSNRYFSSFYGRRTVRIFPLYYLSLIALCIVLPALHADFRDSLLVQNQWWFWTYLSNFLFASEGSFGHTPGGYFWSVAVEEQFYLVWPLVVWTLNDRKLYQGILILFVGGVILRCVMLAAGATTTAVYVLPFTHLDPILLGSLVAVVIRLPDRQLPSRRVSIGLATVAILGLLWVGRRGTLFFWEQEVAAVGLLFIAILAAGLLCALLKAPQESRISRCFRSTPLVSFGQYSYAIYLSHVPIGRVLEKLYFPPEHLIFGSLLPSLAVFIILGGGISWVCGKLSWELFETQCLKLKRYFPAV